MPGNSNSNAQPEYPDVLGTITGGMRHNIDIVQCAFAVYPPSTLTGMFSIIPGHVDTIPPLDVRYETLWSAKEYPNEQAKYAQLAAVAERFAGTLTRTQVYQPLISITEQRFARVGLPLHPGESLFATKLLTYIMEDGLDLEEGFELKQGRWFNRLASIVSDQYMIEDDNRL